MRSTVRVLTLAICLIAFWQEGFWVPVTAQTSGEPQMPQVFLDVPYLPNNSTYTPADSGALRNALTSAQLGDTIVLQAGTNYYGNFTLPNKTTGTGWITIRTSNMAGIPSAGTRVDPSYHSAAMPKIISQNTSPAIQFEAQAHNYRLVGLEIKLDSPQTLNYGLVSIGTGVETDDSTLPSDIIVDRCYIHGHSKASVSRGVALNGKRGIIVDSYFSELHAVGSDAQAVGGWNGPGPFKIVNNYLEASGENVLFGGSNASIPNLVPSDIEFRRNKLSKPQAWQNPLVPAVSGTAATAVSDETSTLPANTTYYYRVIATFNGFGTGTTTPSMDSGSGSSFYNEVTITTGAQTAGTKKAIQISWSPWSSSDGYTPTGYQIYRTTDPCNGGAWVQFAAASTATSFYDKGQTPGGTGGPDRRGAHWSVKNIFELKNASRVWVDGNLMEYNWEDSQVGWAVLFTVRDQGGADPWVVVQDVTFTDNIVRHSAGGVDILAHDDEHPTAAGTAQRIKIKNNLFDDIGNPTWFFNCDTNGKLFQLLSGPDNTSGPSDVHIDHNTALQTAQPIFAIGVNSGGTYQTKSGFIFTNNIVDYGGGIYGTAPGGTVVNNVAVNAYFPSPTFTNNVFAEAPSGISSGSALDPSYVPPGNYPRQSWSDVGFTDKAGGNYRLAAGSTYRNAGTDGKDIGCDFSALEAAMGGKGFGDDFNSASRDTTKWNVGVAYRDQSAFDSQVTALQTSGQLQITPRANVSGNHYNGYVSAPTWDLTASQISVQVVQAASADQTNFLVVLDTNNWYRLVVDTGTLYFQQMVGGVKTTLNSLTYNATQHRFWRIRHDAAVNQIVFETSSDRTTWATQATATPQFAITAVHVELDAGTYQAESSPGTAIFEDFRLDPNNPTPSAGFSDDFNNNIQDTAKWYLGLLNKDQTQYDPQVSVVQQSGQLQIAPLANVSGNHYNGFVSAPAWDFTASQASVEVVQTTNGPGMVLVVGIDYNNWYRFAWEAGTLYSQQMVGGTKTTLNSVTYDATQHRFWRIRHDASANQIVFETSGDRVSWATQATATPQFAITALHVELSAGTYQSWASPGTAIFDNLRFVH